ncbi:MAG: hypothetical protein JO359_05110 [Candidatus Eremiobacteraeota bacterium]|nr:hypothetical protein [Candidatus Eremiobacteraeota bacterium]
MAVMTAAFAALAPCAARADAPTNDELYRYAYSITYPMQCYDASNAVAKLRTKPAYQNDVKQLHAARKAFVACANSDWAKTHPVLMNSSLYSAAAVSLLAARQETGAAATKDAQFTLDATNALLGYTRGPSNYGSIKNQNTPSMLTTNAQRMHDAAKTIIAQGGAPSAATAAAPGTH